MRRQSQLFESRRVIRPARAPCQNHLRDAAPHCPHECYGPAVMNDHGHVRHKRGKGKFFEPANASTDLMRDKLLMSADLDSRSSREAACVRGGGVELARVLL